MRFRRRTAAPPRAWCNAAATSATSCRDTPSGVVRDSWHNGIGGGLRFYLRGVVLPLLGLDFAYGFESNAFQWYVNIGSTID